MEQVCRVDWLEVRSRSKLAEMMSRANELFDPGGLDISVGPRGTLMLGPMAIGWVTSSDFDTRGWNRLCINGAACERIRNWTALDALASTLEAEISRLDLALTTWQGEITNEVVIKAHADGQFRSRGRNPQLARYVSSDPKAGSSCLVGRRGGHKYFRGYDKGLQVARGKPHLTSIAGFPVAGIYRCEVEFRAQGGVKIPWNSVSERDRYLAGAYPFFQHRLDVVGRSMPTERFMAAASIEEALERLRAQYGSTLFTARAYYGDERLVWAKIIGDRHSRPLVRAGVLLPAVGHNAIAVGPPSPPDAMRQPEGNASPCSSK